MGHRLKECINAALWQRVHMWNVAHPIVWYSTYTTVSLTTNTNFAVLEFTMNQTLSKKKVGNKMTAVTVML